MLRLLTTVLSILPLVLSTRSAPATPLPHSSAAQDTDLAQRLERLEQRMEEERISNHIPGFALAVVKDGEVILARGFGLADVENGKPVEADTLFAIGSSTKAFTATLIGMLQDEGAMSFDDPITQHLPNFDLPIQGPDKQGDSTVTVRDLLCHRTGFTRMSLLWSAGPVPIKRILETAVKAEPWAGFREEFLYNNVMFLAAGTASGIAAHSEWPKLIEERIFTPLGMDSSNLSYADSQQDERLALGYSWNTDTESFDREQMRDLQNIAPAGGINSNVLDMAKWLQFQLGHGEYEGLRLIAEDTLTDTWTPNIKIAGGVSYGLGWMLREHKLGLVVEHGGSIDGFAAEVAFIPEAGIGFVLLANITMSPLQQSSIPIVFETLLGELEEEGAATDFDPLLGNYRANFATFDDVDFEVLVQNENLAVDVPGQMIFELHLPDEEGKRYFRMTDQVAVSFHENDAGEIASMKMHQAGMTFEMPREGVVVKAEIPLDELAAFIGTYKDSTQDREVEVMIQNKRLAVDVPGQMTFELKVPGADGKRHFHVSNDLAVRFNEDDNGKLISFTFYEGAEEGIFLRLSGDELESNPASSLDEFLALRKLGGQAALLRDHGTLRTTGTIRAAQAGLEGRFVLEARQNPRAYRFSADFDEFGQIGFGADETSAWSYSTASGHREMSGDRLRQTLREHPALLGGDWSETFDSIDIKRTAEHEDHKVVIVKLSSGELPERTMYVDQETGRLLRMQHLYIEGPVKLPIDTTLSDFREVEGVTLPFETVEKNPATGRTIKSTQSVEVGVELAPDFHAFTRAKD